jgi:hypothetical protein
MASTSSYTLNFSDPTNPNVIVIEGTKFGTGKNNYDTSLDLIGPGYPNFGQATAQNFLKLLENFSGPTPPNNPTTGQLWYDTSEPGRFVLRVNNGTLSTARWPSVSGTYQQPNDPAVEYPQAIREGDIWVDTSVSQLKIRYSTRWLTVGPNVSAGENKTGQDAVTLESTTGATYPVILNWVNGKVVEIISYFDFTPRVVIEGFSNVKAGSNLTSKIVAKYNGLADRASSLEVSAGLIIKANEVLRNRATSQIHTGTFIVESPNGISVKNSIVSESIKISTPSANGVTKAFIDFSNTQTNSTFKLGIKDNSYMLFNSNGQIGINTSTSMATLHVYGTGKFKNAVTIDSSDGAALTVAGGATFGNIIQAPGMQVNGVLTVTNAILLSIPDEDGAIIGVEADESYDLGTLTNKFRKIYAKEVGIGGVTRFIGTLTGSATSLAVQRGFSINGQASSPAVNFNGTNDVALTVSLKRSAITAQELTETPLPTHMLAVADSSVPTQELRQISRANFLKDVLPFLVPTGMVIPFGGTGTVEGFLKCDGSSYNQVTYPALFNVIGETYGSAGAGTFCVPSLGNKLSTSVTTFSPAPVAINYYIKT